MRTRLLVRRLSIVFVLLALAGAAQASVIDQINLPTGEGLNTQFEFQQQVTAGIGGALVGVELYTTPGGDGAAPGNPETDTVSIGLGSAFFTGAFAFSAPAILVESGTYIDTSAAGIDLTPGETFVIDVFGGPSASCCNLAGAWQPYYAGGDMFINPGGGNAPYDYDTVWGGGSIAFETFMGSDATPEPGTLALFGSGILGLALMRRRKTA